ncbi:MAG: hypothetical protein AABY13_04170 [Nanoarchaeota archaeon]
MEQSLERTVQRAQESHVAPDQRTFTVEQAISIINEAEALQRFDKDVQDEHRLHLEGTLATTPMSRDDLTTLAQKAGVAAHYTDRVLDKRYPSFEEQMNDLRMLGSNLNSDVRMKTYLDAVRTMFGQVHQQAFPQGQETLEVTRDYGNGREFSRCIQTSVERVIRPGMIARWCGAKLTKVNEVHKKYIEAATVAVFSTPNMCQITLHDPVFTKLIAAPLAELNRDVAKYFSAINVTHKYVPGNSLEGLKL